MNSNAFTVLTKEQRSKLVEFDVLAKDRLNYWQQAWQKLRGNPRALLSLFFIMLLVLFSSVGPYLWTIDPSYQDLSQVSQPPGMSKKILVLDSANAMKMPEKIFQESDLSAEERLTDLQIMKGSIASTESVMLVWQPDARAAYYQIYRHTFKPRGLQDLGLPLAKTDNKFQYYFNDQLKLETRIYYYSVVARNINDEILDLETLKVEPVYAVSSKKARSNIKKGMWEKANDGEALDSLQLPAHPMGTDYLGRDMMARLMWGGQTSLLISVIASLLFVVIGSIYGAVSAYIGGKADNIMMRFADFIIALPFLLFMILLKVSFGLGPGDSGIGVMIFSLIILSWPSCARLVRAQVLVLREQNFVLVARINGASMLYIVSRHLLPNALSVIFVSLSFAIPSVILTEAFLSFIGLGVVPPTPSWGSMCQEGIKTFLFNPHELIFPATFIGLTVLAFNLLGDGLRDALDVKAEIN